MAERKQEQEEGALEPLAEESGAGRRDEHEEFHVESAHADRIERLAQHGVAAEYVRRDEKRRPDPVRNRGDEREPEPQGDTEAGQPGENDFGTLSEHTAVVMLVFVARFVGLDRRFVRDQAQARFVDKPAIEFDPDGAGSHDLGLQDALCAPKTLGHGARMARMPGGVRLNQHVAEAVGEFGTDSACHLANARKGQGIRIVMNAQDRRRIGRGFHDVCLLDTGFRFQAFDEPVNARVTGVGHLRE